VVDSSTFAHSQSDELAEKRATLWSAAARRRFCMPSPDSLFRKITRGQP